MCWAFTPSRIALRQRNTPLKSVASTSIGEVSSLRRSTESSNLDFIRAVAVLCVVLHHLLNASGRGSDFTWLIGHMGVLIFFVHTALVLMMSLERNAAKLPASLLVVDFYIRRGFRIYPLAMLCVLVTFVGLVPSRPEPWPWSTFLSNLALTMNLTYSEPMWSVLWTLPLELQMYVVLPVMFLWLRRRPVVWAVGGWCMALVAAMSYTHVSSRLNVAMYAPCFVAGVLAWRLMGSVRPRWDGVWWPLAFATSWIVFLTADRRDPEVLAMVVLSGARLSAALVQRLQMGTARQDGSRFREVQLRNLPFSSSDHSVRTIFRRAGTSVAVGGPRYARSVRVISLGRAADD